MSRTLAERMSDWRWWGEQGLHVLVGGAAAATMAVGSPILGGALAAMWIASVREFDQRPIQSWGDTIIDWVCTVVGGIAVGLIIWAVA